MLTWIKAENGNRWIGFDDDCPCYFVDKDEEGWYWEDSWGFGVGGFDTAELAMAECEKDLPKIDPEKVGFTKEELDEIKACMEAHERMEAEKLGLY
jgi:hypothetical protein